MTFIIDAYTGTTPVHDATSWRLYDSADKSTVVAELLNSTDALTVWHLNETLPPGTIYFIEAIRHMSDSTEIKEPLTPVSIQDLETPSMPGISIDAPYIIETRRNNDTVTHVYNNVDPSIASMVTLKWFIADIAGNPIKQGSTTDREITINLTDTDVSGYDKVYLVAMNTVNDIITSIGSREEILVQLNGIKITSPTKYILPYKPYKVTLNRGIVSMVTVHTMDGQIIHSTTGDTIPAGRLRADSRYTVEVNVTYNGSSTTLYFMIEVLGNKDYYTFDTSFQYNGTLTPYPIDVPISNIGTVPYYNGDYVAEVGQESITTRSVATGELRYIFSTGPTAQPEPGSVTQVNYPKQGVMTIDAKVSNTQRELSYYYTNENLSDLSKKMFINLSTGSPVAVGSEAFYYLAEEDGDTYLIMEKPDIDSNTTERVSRVHIPMVINVNSIYPVEISNGRVLLFGTLGSVTMVDLYKETTDIMETIPDTISQNSYYITRLKNGDPAFIDTSGSTLVRYVIPSDTLAIYNLNDKDTQGVIVKRDGHILIQQDAGTVEWF